MWTGLVVGVCVVGLVLHQIRRAAQDLLKGEEKVAMDLRQLLHHWWTAYGALLNQRE